MFLFTSTFFLAGIFSYSLGFLQQQSGRYHAIATNNDRNDILSEEILENKIRKPVGRSSRAIHILFPVGEENFVDPTTQKPTQTSTRRPPKSDPHGKGHGKDTCRAECGCSQQYIPFCATNGITYRNKCQMSCARSKCDPGIQKKFEGVCPEPYHNYRTRKQLSYRRFY